MGLRPQGYKEYLI